MRGLTEGQVWHNVCESETLSRKQFYYSVKAHVQVGCGSAGADKTN